MASSSSNVWVIDDDRSIRWVLERALEQAGMTTMTFDNGDAMLQRLSREQPDVIISDIRMPGIDGIALLERVHHDLPKLPVIIMTGHGDIGLAVKAMKAGAVDFIEKPFEKEALIRSLEEGFNRLLRKEATGDRMRDASVRLQALTAREREVLDGLARGLPNKTIAYDLGISPRTVEIHRANVMTKLSVRSLSEALRIAFAASGE